MILNTKQLVQQIDLSHLVWFHTKDDSLLHMENKQYKQEAVKSKKEKYTEKSNKKINEKPSGGIDFALKMEKEILEVANKYNIKIDTPPKYNTRTLSYIKSAYYQLLQDTGLSKRDTVGVMEFIVELKELYLKLEYSSYKSLLSKSTFDRRRKNFITLQTQLKEYAC